MSVRTPAVQPASISTQHASPGLRLVPSATAPTRPGEASLVVSRLDAAHAAHGTCALCWTGPGPLAGVLRRRVPANQANAQASEQAICSRCLVTLEMLAVQFEADMHLRIETPV